MNYLWGFTSAFVLYWQLSYWFPAKETLLDKCIYDDLETIEGVDYVNDGSRVTPAAEPSSSGASMETGDKKAPHAEMGRL